MSHIFAQSIFFEDHVVYTKSGRVLQKRAGHRWHCSARWTPKAKNKHSEYAILIAFKL